MFEPVTRARDLAITQVASLGDRRPVAVVARWGIEGQGAYQAWLDAYPQLARAVWGLASRRELTLLLERLSALEDTVRQLEASLEKRS